MTDDTPLKPQLWTLRPVEETISVYRDWAQTYDADVKTKAYVTPQRIAAALVPLVKPGTTILDFGCGTGLSGHALISAGFGPLHGCDVTPEMIEIARAKNLYEKLWVAEPGEPLSQTYEVITAMGVVSLGAAPPETLDLLIDGLAPAGLLALSFNQPTVEDGRYDAALTAALDANRVTLLSRETGPHLDGMTSDVIVLKRI